MTFGEGVREGRARFEVNALKGPGLLSAVVWEPTLPSWLDVCCFPFMPQSEAPIDLWALSRARQNRTRAH